MSAPLQITAHLLTKNWMLNFVGQAMILLLALPTIPYIVRGLGAERFGILSIAWVILGYFGLFDAGLGRATTKFAAECLGSGEMERLPGLVWTSLWLQAFFGLLGGLLAAALTPLAVHHLLKISPGLLEESQTSFFILAASLPLVLAANSLRGVLEAGQQFEAVNYVRVPANASVFLLPALGVCFGAHLPAIVLLLVFARGASALLYLFYCFKYFPALRRDFSIDRGTIRALFTYGGWVTVSNVASPLLSYLDRLAIGSLLSMAEVGFYTVPSEAINRLSVIPSSLSTTIFPAFSSLDASGSKDRLERIFVRSLKALLLALGPLSLVIILFARQILQDWLGAEFAAKGTVVLQILAVGLLANSLAFVPFGLLQAVGRPDWTAKFHFMELPFYAALLWLLLKHMGVTGAATAWTIRVSVDACLLFAASLWSRSISIQGFLRGGLGKTIATLGMFGILLAAVGIWTAAAWMKGMFALVLLFAFAIAAWQYLLDVNDRDALLSVAGRLRWNLARAR